MQIKAERTKTTNKNFQLLFFDNESELPIPPVLLDTSYTLPTQQDASLRAIDDNCACEPG